MPVPARHVRDDDCRYIYGDAVQMHFSGSNLLFAFFHVCFVAILSLHDLQHCRCGFSVWLARVHALTPMTFQ